jgi:trehalose 6-phosphate phosphatase
MTTTGSTEISTPVILPPLPRESRPGPPRRLPSAVDWALFLDFDGTLCAYRDDPARVALDQPQRALLLHLLQRLGGAVCVLSGRSAADLERIFGDLPLARVAEHGSDPLALRDAGFLAQLVGAESALLKISNDHPGTWVERKPSSCALHYRRVPEHAERLRTAVAPLAQALDRMRLLDGHCVFEFTTRERSKGSALAARMQLAPFAGRQPVAVGDDVTDEDAFISANDFGGFGVAVGARPSAAARFHLDDSAAVTQWLAALAGDGDAAA